MSESRFDPVSGIPEDVLSLVVYSFFPTSHRHFTSSKCSYKLNAPFIVKTEIAEFIDIGSKPEYLWLPLFIDKEGHEFAEGMLGSHRDTMVDFGWFESIYNFISLEMENRPVFCRIKLNIPDGFPVDLLGRKGSYLSSEILNKESRNAFSTTITQSAYTRRINPTYQEDQDFLGIPAFATLYYDESRIGSIYIRNDFVFCLPVSCSEEIEKNFLRRVKKSSWPWNHLKDLDKIFSERVYVVPKPYEHSETGDLRWRLSFSVLEVQLARSLTEIQRRCFRVMKAIIKFDINENLSEKEKYPSYFLKTTMFWFCEKTTEDAWKIENLGSRWLNLLEQCIENLEKKKLPHYFVPAYNLLDDKPPNTMKKWLKRFREIRQKPFEAFSKFWSKYAIYEMNGIWGFELSAILEHLNLIYSQVTDPSNFKSGYLRYVQLQQYNTEAKICAACLRVFIAKYQLTQYSLVDFLKFVKHYPETQSWVDNPHRLSQVELIWSYYSRLLVMSSESDEIPDWLTSLAEVTHHMVLKDGDNVPDRGLFNKETSERFHLMACSVRAPQNRNSGKFVKYANYLRVEKRYEDAVNVLMFVCQTPPSTHYCYFNSITSEVLDVCLKLELALQDEIGHSQKYIAYHFLTCCYIQAGVLAEVCIPEDIYSNIRSMASHEPFLAVKKILLGFQYILCGQMLEALFWFNSISDMELAHDNLPKDIKYVAMMYIVARIVCKLLDDLKSSPNETPRKKRKLK